jgi:hypothetical protein
MTQEEFDNYINQAILEERERIIKLLEENWVEPMDWLSVEALIKGEKSE